jgi:adenylate kinase
MKVLLVGQVGLDKAAYLLQVQELAEKQAQVPVHFETIGQKMIQLHNSPIDEKRILNLDRGYLEVLRRLAWKDLQSAHRQIADDEIFIVSTHGLFRWHHGLIPSIDLDLLTELAPDFVMVLIDDVHSVKKGHQQRGTDFLELWELLAWREEEIWFTKFLVDSLNRLPSTKSASGFFILPKSQGAELLYRILMEPNTPKVYISFPITGLPNKEMAAVEKFKGDILQRFIAFDPYSIAERSIVTTAESLSEEIADGFDTLKEIIAQLSQQTRDENLRWTPVYDNWSAFGLTELNVGDVALSGRQVLSVLGAVDSQIISRDYLLIDQSDFILMYIREGEDGQPQISAGCQSEMVYAYSKGKPVYVVCSCGKGRLSPFVTQYSEVFETLPKAVEFLEREYKC